MHLIEKLEGEAAKSTAKRAIPFGAGFPDEIVALTEKLEIHGSGVLDPGPDFCEFTAFNAEGDVVGERRVGGY
jgi:hypothetical protein